MGAKTFTLNGYRFNFTGGALGAVAKPLMYIGGCVCSDPFSKLLMGIIILLCIMIIIIIIKGNHSLIKGMHGDLTGKIQKPFNGIDGQMLSQLY